MDMRHQDAQEISCAMCDKMAKYKCPICQGPAYCGVRHQKAAWVTHESECNVIHSNNPMTPVMLPFDLVDETGASTVIRTMLCATDTEGTQHVDIIDSEVGEGITPAELVGARRRGGSFFGFKRRSKQEREVPKLARPGATRGIGPNEGVGSGRAPRAEELDEGEGKVKLTISHYRSYQDKFANRREPIGRWSVAVKLDDAHLLYQANNNERVMSIMNLRAIRERDGLVVWFPQNALDALPKFELPTTGGYLDFVVQRSFDSKEIKSDAIYGNLRYLRSSRAKALKRFTSRGRLFGSGMTAKAQLKAKGLRPESDYILYMHDKRPDSGGMRVQLTVRTGDTKNMKPVDIEVFLPDAANWQKDSPLDSDAMIAYPIQVPIKCDVSSQEQIDGLVMALKEHVALLSDAENVIDAEMHELDLDMPPPELKEIQTRQQRLNGWLDVIQPHSAKLQEQGPSFVGSDYRQDFTDLNVAINEALSYLLIERKSKFFGKLKRKAMQRQYEAQIKQYGPRWAMTKMDSEEWQNNRKKLALLRKALIAVSVKFKFQKNADRDMLQQAIDRVNGLLNV